MRKKITPTLFKQWLEKLDKAYEVYADLVGGTPCGGEKLRFVPADPAIEKAFAYVMGDNRTPYIFFNVTCIPETMASIQNTGGIDTCFGILHEIGHLFDLDNKWTFHSEFFANIKMYYVLEKTGFKINLEGIETGQARLIRLYEKQLKLFNETEKNYQIFESSSAEPQLLVFYPTLLSLGGWDSGWKVIKQVFSNYYSPGYEQAGGFSEEFTLAHEFYHTICKISKKDITTHFPVRLKQDVETRYFPLNGNTETIPFIKYNGPSGTVLDGKSSLSLLFSQKASPVAGKLVKVHMLKKEYRYENNVALPLGVGTTAYIFNYSLKSSDVPFVEGEHYRLNIPFSQIGHLKTIMEGDIHLYTNANVTITGVVNNNRRIVVESGAKNVRMIFENLSITTNIANWSPIQISGAEVQLTLADKSNNALHAIAENSAGICTDNAILAVYGNGSLTVQGGPWRPAIGGVKGNITIHNGTIHAVGGANAAGIGGKNRDLNDPVKYGDGNGGIIKINGGTVTAVGGGSLTACYGGAGIGGGGNRIFSDMPYDGGDSGKITITGGAIEAQALSGASIGGGNKGAGETITISGGRIKAIKYAKGQDTYGACIGGGLKKPAGNIFIRGGTIYTKSTGGPGLGGWGKGTITITGGSVECTTVVLTKTINEAGQLVYKNTLSFPFETSGQVSITGGSINGVDCDTGHSSEVVAQSGYGIYDVKMENSKLYIWLPAVKTIETICFVAAEEEYAANYARPEQDIQQAMNMAKREVSFDKTKIIFPDEGVGYKPVEKQTIIVTNTGTLPSGKLKILSTGIDSGFFETTVREFTGIDVGASETFKIGPLHNLPYREMPYTAQVYVEGTDGIGQYLDVSFKVNAC